MLCNPMAIARPYEIGPEELEIARTGNFSLQKAHRGEGLSAQLCEVFLGQNSQGLSHTPLGPVLKAGYGQHKGSSVTHKEFLWNSQKEFL